LGLKSGRFPNPVEGRGISTPDGIRSNAPWSSPCPRRQAAGLPSPASMNTPDITMVARLARRGICDGDPAPVRGKAPPPLPFANLGLTVSWPINPQGVGLTLRVPPSGIRGKPERPRVIADPVRHFGRLSRGGWSLASQDRSRNPCPTQMPPPSPPASPPR
jgi:hypothetical protein